MKICFDYPGVDAVEDLSIRVCTNYGDLTGPEAYCTPLDAYDCTYCELDFYERQNDIYAKNYGIYVSAEDAGSVDETWFNTWVYAETPSYKLPPLCEIYGGFR